MRKIIIAIIVIVILGVGYFLISKQSLKSNFQQNNQQQESGQSASEKMPFDTDDNLDEAIEELNQIQ